MPWKETFVLDQRKEFFRDHGLRRKMRIIIDKEQEFYPDQETFIDSVVEDKAVIFEIDEATAYFYATSFNNNNMKILDSLHIFNIVNLSDSEEISKASIL